MEVLPTTFAGTPATVMCSGTSSRTTLPAAIFAPSPISTFPKILAHELIKTPFLTLGCLSPTSFPVPPRVTPWNIETSSSITEVSPITIPVA